jgi:F1F0 ATPase subunit 2
MNESLPLVLAGVQGLLLGTLYFSGLWWTVRRAATSAHPARLFLGSLLIRAGAAVAAFYMVGRGHWERMAICLVAFIVAEPRDARLAEVRDES